MMKKVARFFGWLMGIDPAFDPPAFWALVSLWCVLFVGIAALAVGWLIQ